MRLNTFSFSSLFLTCCIYALMLVVSDAFSPALPTYSPSASTSTTSTSLLPPSPHHRRLLSPLYMSSMEKDRRKKTGKKVGLKEDERTKTDPAEEKKKESTWRVVLHNDEVHTFQYVIRSLTKIIGTLDRKAAFEICVQTHGIGKATITKTWKKQAEQFCLGLQRQGLTVSIAPDEDFEGGHSGGGL